MIAKCEQCGKPVKPPRRKFCSAACSRQHTAESTREYRTEWQQRWRAVDVNREAEQARARQLTRRLRRDARRYQQARRP